MKSDLAIAGLDARRKRALLVIQPGPARVELDDQRRTTSSRPWYRKTTPSSRFGLDLAPAVPAMAAKLKDIGEVGEEVEGELEDRARRASKLRTLSRS